MKTKEIKTFSVVAAARQLRCSMKRVYDVIREGKLEATKVDGRWRIAGEAIEAWRRRREGEVRQRCEDAANSIQQANREADRGAATGNR